MVSWGRFEGTAFEQDFRCQGNQQKRCQSASSNLDKLIKHAVTPVIGTEFKEGVQIADLLSAPNSDDLIRDLAILGIWYSL